MDRQKKKTETQGGRYAYDGLDRVLHEKARLGIMTSLATRPDGLLFNELKDLCALTDGNLSRHIQVLEEAGYVEVWKGFKKRRPQTLCRLTTPGREGFLKYLEELERVVRDASELREAAKGAGNPLEKAPGGGWAPA